MKVSGTVWWSRKLRCLEARSAIHSASAMPGVSASTLRSLEAPTIVRATPTLRNRAKRAKIARKCAADKSEGDAEALKKRAASRKLTTKESGLYAKA